MVDRRGTVTDVSFEIPSGVVGSIYDCALEPSRWKQTLGMIADLCRSHYGLFGLLDLRNEQFQLLSAVGFPERYRQHLEEKYAPKSAYLNCLKRLPVATVATRAMLVDKQDISKCFFYEDFLEPLEICDAIGFTILKTRRRVALLAFHRSESQGRYGQAELRTLSLLAPHVVRSMSISDAVDRQTIRSEALEKTLESLLFGVYLVDRQGRIVFINREGDRQVRTSDALRIGHTRLVPVETSARVELTNAIAKAVSQKGETASDDITILALPGEENTGLVATILPLGQGQRLNSFSNLGAAAAVFIQDPFAEAVCSGEGFAKLYGLTTSELRVLVAMSPGLGVKEAAEKLGISEATAKTHLQHVHAKTGISKHTELMRLFRGSMPPIEVALQSSPQSASAKNACAAPNRLRCRDSRKGLRSGALFAGTSLAEMVSEIQICCLLTMGL